MSGRGRGGTGVLKVDGRVVASQETEGTAPLMLQWDKTFDVGADTGNGPGSPHDNPGARLHVAHLVYAEEVATEIPWFAREFSGPTQRHTG